MYKQIMHVLNRMAILFVLVQCTPDPDFHIEGSFDIVDPTPVQVFQLSDEEAVLVDSTHTVDGRFELSGAIEYPGIYLLKFFNDQRIFLILYPGDALELQIDNRHELISYYVKNSPDSKRIKELTDKQNYVLRTIDQLSGEWAQAGVDSTLRRTIDSSYHATLREHRAATREFIHANPGSLANIMALYQNIGRKSQTLFDPYDDHDLFSFVDSNLIARYPNTKAVQALNHEVHDIRAQIAQKKLIEKVVKEGRPLPPFAYPTITGDTIRLHNKQRKASLLLFWATWNTYSVQQIQQLNAFARKKGLRNLDIVTISLDSSVDELQTFLDSNAIQVPVVCDYRYWDSELPARYAIKRIPSTLLVNQEGIVVGKDIFGSELIHRAQSLIP